MKSFVNFGFNKTYSKSAYLVSLRNLRIFW